ncbi:membrane fusion protein [Vibrio ishigakensis]|uniref:Membrane fusion protein n=1 Tax=Vibrio ishigakensis TaxID=1481914 RepID=A0A0B8PNV9_9VIBR|nr:HlyD family secretion protein [Vibrio ishigakensis]GAM57969.1 membrane fusion protein [Vibrio ishigakensis]GAM64364.1 membrane fusion protein [Vibrio ishigakensis]GAM68648.1 membrane fusion proein [Vibrio sp. JCM 19236]GAM76161.1 membrane fusion protein [Vibrio ishigakensis]
MKKYLKGYLAAVVVLGVVGALAYYWHYSDLHPSTENAYVHGKVVSVAPLVNGRVTKISVDDYQFVHMGDHLITIDPTPYQLAVKEAQAAYSAALQTNKSQESGVNAAIATLNEAKANLENAQKNYRRTQKLLEQKLVPIKQGDTDRTTLADAQAHLHAAQANLQQAIDAQGGKGEESIMVQQAAAKLAQAELNLSYTEISAPFDGYVGDIKLHLGTFAATGQPLFPLVKQYSQWVQANFKESQMPRLREGQSVEIKVDMYPDVVWHGKLAKISPASGTAFSLLPPENATGNWVKIGQRFPIKIEITDDLASKPQLRIGASTEVTVDTTAGE